MNTVEKPVFVMKMFYECRSVFKAQHKFRSHFHCQSQQIPNRNEINSLIAHFEKIDTIHDRQK